PGNDRLAGCGPDKPRLLQAQYIALSRQLPLMYFV
ncbi:hypothetical protein Pgy4_41589, partial [Pseudomonas savastanoi pv. glycinea str. race 4]